MERETIDMTQYRQRLFEQKQILQDAVRQLKTEFIGIDTVIDQVADAVSPWLYFPEMQDRPVIINLWGLTGTGKTSLVKRLSELLGFSDRYFRFDLGESTKSYYGVQDTFRDIYESSNGEPFIIGLDEFQHARTINEDSEEIDKASSRSIWDLLDSGKFDMIDFEYNVNWFNKLIKCLDRALEKGVEVENGYITANKPVYDEIMQTGNDSTDNDEDEGNGALKKTYFISDDNLRTIYDMVDFMYISKSDLRQKLDEMDGEETLAFLVYLYKKSIRPKTIDCTQALVFVMGNLDEVYTMNRNFNPDMSANEFHRQSCRITITQVKEALLARFRSEQIARLGNTHIIYPTLDEQAFYEIIRLELEKVRWKVSDAYGLEMKFDERVETLIYDEGVYPTQGTRPLFTTVHQIVNTRLGKILNEIYLNGIAVDSLLFTVKDEDSHASDSMKGVGIKAATCSGKGNQQPEKTVPVNAAATDTQEFASLQIDFVKDGETVHSLVDRQPLVLGKLRKAKKDDEQAIVAVHESGHAILSAVLMKTLPDSVFSVTADSGSGGFVFARPEWNYISKKEIINRLAMLLGGFVAERIVFGEENVTMGSGSDLQQATQLATQVIYSCGMGNSRAAFGNQHTDHAPGFILDSSNDGINKEAEELLSEAEGLAQQTLEKQKVLLLKMADYLSDHRSANKATVREMIEKYAVDFSMDEIVENGQHLFYREHLKKLVGEV